MGWASGLQSGMALGNLINQGFDRRELAEEVKKHKLEERDYAPVNDFVAQRDEAAKGLIAQGMASDQAYQQATEQYLPQIQEASRVAGLTPQYSYGGQGFDDRQAAEQALSQGRTQGMANVYRAQGNEEQASALEARALQNRAAGLTVNKQQREADQTRLFDTGLADINKQEFEKPEQRTAAILDLVEQTRGPEARMELESKYTRGQLDKITMKAAEFEQGFKQAFTKGVDPTMKWLDDQDPGFTLKRVGNQVIQTNLDGSTRVFAQGNDSQIMEQFAGQASPAAFLTLSKNIADRKNDELRTSAYLKANTRPDWMSAVDSKGTLQLVDRNKLKVTDGVAELPKGLKPVSARAEYTAADVLKMSDQLAGQTNPDTNKPYTPEEAVAESKRILSGAQDPFMAKLDAVLGGSGDPFAKTAPKDKGKEGLSAEPPTVQTAPEERFARQKTNRGAYTYTPSNRGLTKAQFEEIDRKKQIR